MTGEAAPKRLTRRRWLTLAATALPGLVLLAPWRKTRAESTEDRTLAFHHTHTDEKLVVRYFTAGRYDAEALSRLDHLLRDFRTGDERKMDRKLYDLLHEVHTATGSEGTFEIISAYRSPETNAMLRSKSKGVAEGSLHVKGKAIDLRLTDVETLRLRDTALALKRGGVGYYPKSDFVHLDTGRVRRWGG